MNRTHNFRKKIISFLKDNKVDNDLFSWMEAQPEIDKPQILREFKTVLEERFKKKSEVDWNEVSALMDNKIQEFEETILDTKLQKALFLMEMENRITDEDTFGYYLDYTRQELISRIIAEPENQENLQLAQKLIKMEKDTGFYNHDNWKVIF